MNDFTHHGVNVEIDEELVADAQAMGIDILDEIREAIDHSVPRAEIYSKPNCTYCVKAKALLNKHDITFVEFSAVEERDVLIERVEAASGATPKSVPQIFLDGKYIGGHDQLVSFLETLSQ